MAYMARKQFALPAPVTSVKPSTYQNSLFHVNSFCNNCYVMKEQLDRITWLESTFLELQGLYRIVYEFLRVFYYYYYFLSVSCSTHRACRCCLLVGRERWHVSLHLQAFRRMTIFNFTGFPEGLLQQPIGSTKSKMRSDGFGGIRTSEGELVLSVLPDLGHRI